MTNNPTEQQATPNSRERLREMLLELFYTGSGQPTGDGLTVDESMQLIQQEIEKAKLEARINEMNMIVDDPIMWENHSIAGVIQQAEDRIEELSKLQEEQK